VRAELSAVAEARNDAEIKIEGDMSAEIKTAAMGKANVAENKIEEASEFIVKFKALVDADISSDAEAKLKIAQEAFARGEAEMKAQTYGTAFVSFQESMRIAQEAKLIIASSEKLENNSNVDDDENDDTDSDDENSNDNDSVNLRGNGTVEENIRFYDDRVTDTDIEFAVSAAGLSSVIAKLPAGIKSAVGERGNALSGGERQRVALARVLARRPELLILDEPTSALDASAEMVIRDALLELRGAITIVIIAHKIDTVRAADRVVVISDGGVIEEGAPSVLLTDPNSQFSRFFKGGENAPMI